MLSYGAPDKFNQKRIKVRGNTYISSTLDDYPPLKDYELTTIPIKTDIDTFDGVNLRLDRETGRGLHKYRHNPYELQGDEKEKKVFPLRNVDLTHYFTEIEYQDKDNEIIRLEAFKATYVFDTIPEVRKGYYEYEGDSIYRTPRKTSVGEVPKKVEYVFKYGVNGKQKELLTFGTLYYCEKATALYPDAVIWCVRFDSQYLFGRKYPKVIKELKKFHHQKDKENREQSYTRGRDEYVSGQLSLNAETVESYVSAGAILPNRWTSFEDDVLQANEFKQSLENLTPRVLTFLVPTLNQYALQGRLDAIIGEEVQVGDSAISTISETTVLTNRKRSHTEHTGNNSTGTVESAYTKEDSDEATDSGEVSFKLEYETQEEYPEISSDTDTDM
jgi:hypothetical protein